MNKRQKKKQLAKFVRCKPASIEPFVFKESDIGPTYYIPTGSYWAQGYYKITPCNPKSD